MALRFADSFDHYATADLAKKWTSSTTAVISAGNGRNSTACLRCSGSVVNTITLGAQTTWIVGFAFRTNALAMSSDFLHLYDGTTLHVGLRTNGSGNMTVTRAGTLLGTGSAVLAINTYYHIAFKCNISDTTGTPVWYINGVQDTVTWVTGTSSTQDTRNGGNASADRINLASGGVQVDIDDFYVMDTSGSVNNDIPADPDLRVEALFANGTGNYSQWSRLSGAANYEMVDEASADGDTTYNYELTANDIDTYTMTNLTPTTGTIVGVQTNLWARKDDGGTRSVKPLFRISSTDYARTTVNLTDTYLDRLAIEETSPATATAWTISEVNGLEFGAKVV